MHLYILIISSSLLFIGIILSGFTAKIGVPTLLAFLCLGLMFGNGGKYDFTYDYPDLTFNLAQVALCMILFAGGLNTDFKTIKPVIRQGLVLSTFGVLISTFICGCLIYVCGILNWSQSFLLGAIISSTDAAAVFSILETKQLRLKENISPVLELESGTNDPVAYFLTVTLTFFIKDGQLDAFQVFFSFLYNMSVGVLLGMLIGYFSHLILKGIKLNTGQKPVLIVSVIIFSFSLSEIIHVNSFLAVYIAGITLGNLKLNVSYIGNYFQQISWLMEIFLFTILGLQVFIQDLPAVVIPGIIVSLILIFVARPVAVFLGLSIFQCSWKKKLYISWVGLRGATPIVFALIPVIYAIPSAKVLFNIAFFVVIFSISIQGMTLGVLARFLKITH
ncbi:MAG: potassium/proton antiporter [Microscillaceae bacterium]|nr:potassium/proton antiporter [Microscillaceae bacterium]